jgi:single-strand DNA-binding protein
MRTTSTGKSVADISIAVTKKYKPQDGSPDADFFRVTAWDKTADFVFQYVGKGRLVAVDGRLSSRKFTAKDGSEREVVEIVADSVQSLDRPKDGEGALNKAATTPRAKAAAIDEYDPFAGE